MRLPEREEQLWMLVVKGFGQKPLMLLTTEALRKSKKVLRELMLFYFKRWKIEETIRQATILGIRIDVAEENLWDQMLGLGRLLLTSFVAGQGTGDLGPTLEYEGRILNRLAQLHDKPYMSVFGALPPIERTVYGTRETQKHEVIPLDARLGLPESDYSYLLQQWSQSFCVKGSHKDAQSDLEQILRLRPSIRVLEDMNVSMSKDVRVSIISTYSFP